MISDSNTLPTIQRLRDVSLTEQFNARGNQHDGHQTKLAGMPFKPTVAALRPSSE